MKKILTTITLALLLGVAYGQLDPLYNQYQFNQLMINPAYAGIYDRFSASLISRLNWVGIEGAPVTNTLTVQSSLRNGSIGLGALLIDDRLGVNRNMEGSITASYNIKFEEAKLAMGIQGGLINYGFDLSKLTLDYIDDERLMTGLDNYTEPNFGAGIMYMNPVFFAGISVPRLRELNVDDGVSNSTRYKRHYYGTVGYFYEASQLTQYKITSLLRYVENGDISVDVSVSTFLDQVIWAGLTVRDLKHYGLFVNFHLGENLRVGYAFELPTNSLIIGNYGTHEVSVAFDATVKRNRPLSQRRF
ncbi:MAG: PorP/SprF family type IX secretion system membrane protein [Bacteroidota bacterium]